MDEQLVLYVGKRTLEIALLISTPVLVVALVIGVVTAMLQTVTSLRDTTLGMILKLVGVGVTLLVAGGWMMQTTTGFVTEVFGHMQALGH
jgi:flagellar biosynthesis protein FliQ